MRKVLLQRRSLIIELKKVTGEFNYFCKAFCGLLDEPVFCKVSGLQGVLIHPVHSSLSGMQKEVQVI